MSDDVSVEATGETVGEAKWAALRELEHLAPGIDREAVRFQVVSEGERGLLGVGYMPARVLATVERPVAPAATDDRPSGGDEGGEAAVARGLLERTLAALGVTGTTSVVEEEDIVTATVSGPDLGVLIGRHGQMIDALQYLANAIAHRAVGEERRRIVIDAAGYRARRAVTLESLARRSAEQASATGHRVELEPMSSVERRLVHEALKDDPEVETESEGTEPNRYVVVLPRRSVD
ncbi:MAG TPA: RNA-binding cell elongation regulator Jag/EloR [Gaiella sp.]